MIDEFRDERVIDRDTRTLLLKIRNLIRECEKYDIDYEEYISKGDLLIMIETLECCLKHKDNPKLERRRWND